MATPPPARPPVRIRLLNRQMGHHSVPVVLKGQSGRAYGTISRFSPPDNCHAVELTLEQYEAARADLFKGMRLHARRIWEVAVETLPIADCRLPIEPAADGLADFQRRVVAEKKELDERLDKLRVFIKESPIFGGLPEHEQHLLREQETAMSSYSVVLSVRIEGFKKPEGKPSEPSQPPAHPFPPLSTVDQSTPWNALQKIAKAEGIDLKQHKNRPALLQAIAARRSQLASAAA